MNVNPKEAIGLTNLPLTLVSPLLNAYACIGKLNGKEKYGMSNYNASPVLMSIYLDAIRRHFDKILAGQIVDASDNVPHWSAILANIDIIVSAEAAGTLIDDRPLVIGYEGVLDKLTPLVKSLQELHKDKTPRDFTLKDKK